MVSGWKICILGLIVSANVYAETLDGEWKGNAALTFSRANGNTESTTYSAAVDEVRTTEANKITAYLSALYGRSQGVMSSDKKRGSLRYDQNLSNQVFAFGLLELEQDKMANLSLRNSVAAGAGYNLIKNDLNSWDVLGGLSYSDSKLLVGNPVFGTEILLGEESTHKLTQTVSFRQKLSYYPILKQSGQFRSLFDTGLVIGLSGSMGLSINLQNKYNSDVGVGVHHSDTVLLTGLNIKL